MASAVTAHLGVSGHVGLDVDRIVNTTDLSVVADDEANPSLECRRYQCRSAGARLRNTGNATENLSALFRIGRV